MTEGAELSQLWHQFLSEARSSYGLYSRDVDWERVQTGLRWKRPFRACWALFRVLLMKLTPARRVMLLAAVVFLLWPRVEFTPRGSIVVIEPGTLGVLLLFVLLALELADRVTMKRDLEIAREIQHRLLPERPPEIPGFEMSFRSRPANTVGGDYYDAFPRPGKPSRILVAVADVAGKSVPAALLMATFQASLEALAALPGNLTDLAQGLNRYTSAHSLDGLRFTTAFVAELEPSTGALEYVNAGHNAPFLLRSSGATERLEATGVPLGIAATTVYSASRVQLAAGDLLAVFSDGLTEAVDEREQEYGEARLRAVLDRMRGTSAHELLEAVFFDVDRYVGQARQHDDITCLVLRRSATP
ncbi:MAG TPA: PP2C family protein-serine/threonine phosphatase [Candidatus Acidoferrales bacterium]|nr:PP2C family protein-serine/threonine phosphatase [Candidatus Acidoferrales bacterium]